MSNENMLIILCSINILSFGIGYVCGKLNTNSGGVLLHQNRPQSFFDKEKNNKISSDIVIDDKKYVTNITTEGLEKKYTTLGDTKKSDDNISASVNKLKNMKG